MCIEKCFLFLIFPHLILMYSSSTMTSVSRGKALKKLLKEKGNEIRSWTHPPSLGYIAELYRNHSK